MTAVTTADLQDRNRAFPICIWFQMQILPEKHSSSSTKPI